MNKMGKYDCFFLWWLSNLKEKYNYNIFFSSSSLWHIQLGKWNQLENAIPRDQPIRKII